ncbi:MAG: hypothetical protein K9W44_07885 [Candidatus Lokiarchaeota archaeon]|nr:hypothetical protein [Candidatus Harpocratesius repetitus]
MSQSTFQIENLLNEQGKVKMYNFIRNMHQFNLKESISIAFTYMVRFFPKYYLPTHQTFTSQELGSKLDFGLGALYVLAIANYYMPIKNPKKFVNLSPKLQLPLNFSCLHNALISKETLKELGGSENKNINAVFYMYPNFEILKNFPAVKAFSDFEKFYTGKLVDELITKFHSFYLNFYSNNMSEMEYFSKLIDVHKNLGKPADHIFLKITLIIFSQKWFEPLHFEAIRDYFIEHLPKSKEKIIKKFKAFQILFHKILYKYDYISKTKKYSKNKKNVKRNRRRNTNVCIGLDPYSINKELSQVFNPEELKFFINQFFLENQKHKFPEFSSEEDIIQKFDLNTFMVFTSKIKQYIGFYSMGFYYTSIYQIFTAYLHYIFNLSKSAEIRQYCGNIFEKEVAQICQDNGYSPCKLIFRGPINKKYPKYKLYKKMKNQFNDWPFPIIEIEKFLHYNSFMEFDVVAVKGSKVLILECKKVLSDILDHFDSGKFLKNDLKWQKKLEKKAKKILEFKENPFWCRRIINEASKDKKEILKGLCNTNAKFYPFIVKSEGALSNFKHFSIILPSQLPSLLKAIDEEK